MNRLVPNPYIISIAIQVSTLFIGICTSLLASRWLGPIGIGQLTTVGLWPALLAQVGSLGIGEAVAYFVASNKYESKDILLNSLVISVTMSLLLMLIGYCILPILLMNQATFLLDVGRIYLLSIPMMLISGIVGNLLRGHLRFYVYGYLQLLMPIGYLLALLVMEFRSIIGVVLIVVVLLGLQAIITSICISYLIHYGTFRNPVLNLELMSGLLKYGLRAYASTIFSSVNLRLDQAFLAIWFLPSVVGLYSTAASTVTLSYVLPTSIYNASVPIIASLSDSNERKERFRSLCSQYWVLSLSVTSLMIFLLPIAIPFMYGEAFRGASTYAIILSIAAFLWGAKIIFTSGAYALGYPHLSSRAEIAAAILTIILLIIFLPIYGPVAAALISVLAYGIGAFLIIFGLARQTGVPLHAFFNVVSGAKLLYQRFRNSMQDLLKSIMVR